MYDLYMKEEYKDGGGEKKAMFHKVGVAFDAKKGGFDLVIAPGVAISGKPMSGRARNGRGPSTMAPTSLNDGPLLIGAVRAYPDHKADWIVIETAKDNPHGYGRVVCWVPMSGMADARMIKALPDLLKDAEPFAALGRELAEGGC